MKDLKIIIVLFILIILFSCNKIPKINADLIIHNAKIWTGNKILPFATSIAISDDSIISIGESESTFKFKNENTKIIDVKNKLIVPGFIDCHIHLIFGGRSLLSVDLRDVHSKEEFKKIVGNYAKKLKPGEWIQGGNWDHTLWGSELPNKNWIDDVTKNNPVLLFRLDGHMALANTLALKFAGIDNKIKDVLGGEIKRDKNNNLTGILKDNAINLIIDKLPKTDTNTREKEFNSAVDYLLSNGITSIFDVDGLNKNEESFSIASKHRANNKLKLRIYAINPLNEWKKLSEIKNNNNKWLKIGGLKGFVDGSLGSHTAALIDFYTDKPKEKGLFINSKEDLYNWISGADKSNLQIMVHAIGDNANSILLDIYEKVIKENGKRDRRFKIEHAQHIAEKDIKRFGELGVIASMQPYHLIDDGRWAEKLIGKKRVKTSYVFRSLLDNNALLVFGSDWPVAPASPLWAIYAAVTRRTLDNKNPDGWVPEQKISVEEALMAYTKNAAFSMFDEKIKGMLEIGKLADFVVLSEDIFNIEPQNIKDVKVLQTYVGGKKVYGDDF